MNIQRIGTAIVIEHSEGVCILNHNDIESVFTRFNGQYTVWAATAGGFYKLNVLDTMQEATELAMSVYSRTVIHIKNDQELLGVMIEEED